MACSSMVDCLSPKGVLPGHSSVSTHDKRGGELRHGNAVLFMSRDCDRHNGFMQRLIASINWDIGVDSFGACFRNRNEETHARYVPGNAAASREHITRGYKFNLVVENALVDDYVTEKFYEGLKGDALMVYLGAPNIHQYAPADQAFVNVGDWADAEEVGRLLIQLHRNQTLYNEYFRWRHSESALAHGSLSLGQSDGAPAMLVRNQFEHLAMTDFARTDAQSWQCRVCGVYVDRYCAMNVH